MAERAKASIVEIPTSHASMVSQPDAVTELILTAVNARAGGRLRFRSPSREWLPHESRVRAEHHCGCTSTTAPRAASRRVRTRPRSPSAFRDESRQFGEERVRTDPRCRFEARQSGNVVGRRSASRSPCGGSGRGRESSSGAAALRWPASAAQTNDGQTGSRLVIGRDGASVIVVRDMPTLIDADIAGAFADVLPGLAEPSRDRVWRAASPCLTAQSPRARIGRETRGRRIRHPPSGAPLPLRMHRRQRSDQRRQRMPTIAATDGTEIFYKDWGSGEPIVFSHGWPLSADDWDTQMLFFLQHGYRVIAHDRRGHGRSTQTSHGHDMDHYADDLAALTDDLDLQGAVHVGHSTGGGEVVHYVARHGESRVAKAVLISAVPPLMVQTDANPGGLPKSVFDDLQAQLAANRSEFYRALPSGPFYGFNRPGVESSEAIIENWWRQGMMGGAKAHYDGIVAFSQTDFTEDLKKITVPVLVMHGDDDQIVPYADSAPLSAKLVQNGTLKTYEGFPHGMPTTQAETINADLLAFLQS